MIVNFIYGVLFALLALFLSLYALHALSLLWQAATRWSTKLWRHAADAMRGIGKSQGTGVRPAGDGSDGGVPVGRAVAAKPGTAGGESIVPAWRRRQPLRDPRLAPKSRLPPQQWPRTAQPAVMDIHEAKRNAVHLRKKMYD